MQVGKWGNSLAIRLPAHLVEALQLHEGDEVVVEAAGERQLQLKRDTARDEAVARLEALDWPAPPGFRVNRDEANER